PVRQRIRHLVHQRVLREEVEAGLPAMRLALEPEDPVPLAHPVMAGLAIAALVAGHDLLGDDPVTLADTPLLGRALAKRHDPAGVLVPGNDRPLDVPAGAVLAPEERSAE